MNTNAGNISVTSWLYTDWLLMLVLISCPANCNFQLCIHVTGSVSLGEMHTLSINDFSAKSKGVHLPETKSYIKKKILYIPKELQNLSRIGTLGVIHR